MVILQPAKHYMPAGNEKGAAEPGLPDGKMGGRKGWEDMRQKRMGG
jgi:hypothetical protein